jgi:hypothetical protein
MILSRPVCEGELVNEIQRLENHLHHLRGGDESAYEKALIRSYETVLADHHHRLAQLRTA